MLNETKHDYQGCLVGNAYDSRCTGEYDCWDDFVKGHNGFCGSESKYDDTYNFVFRYDISKDKDSKYCLELCMMLQRKGVYTHIYINNIPQNTLDVRVKPWLEGRCEYMKGLWKEVL